CRQGRPTLTKLLACSGAGRVRLGQDPLRERLGPTGRWAPCSRLSSIISVTVGAPVRDVPPDQDPGTLLDADDSLGPKTSNTSRSSRVNSALVSGFAGQCGRPWGRSAPGQVRHRGASSAGSSGGGLGLGGADYAQTCLRTYSCLSIKYIA